MVKTGLIVEVVYTSVHSATFTICLNAALRLDETLMTTSILCQKILLIENDPAVANAIRVALVTPSNGSFDVERVCQLSEGLERLSKKGIAAVLLELDLPDSHGIETFDKLFAVAPDVPILILGGNVK